MSYLFFLRRHRTTQERRSNQKKNGGWHRSKRNWRHLPDVYHDDFVDIRIYRNWKKQYKVSPVNSRAKHKRTHQHQVKCMGCGVTIRRFIMSEWQPRKRKIAFSEAPLHCL